MVASGNQYEICIKKGREHRAVLTPERVNSPTEFFYTAYQISTLGNHFSLFSE